MTCMFPFPDYLSTEQRALGVSMNAHSLAG
jgi:hypothetical protein